MAFVQATTGHGGWPMSVWLTPDLKPFVGGTYFPPEDAHGRPGFKSVLEQLAAAWKKDEKDMRAEAGQMTERVREIASGSDTPSADLPPASSAMTLRSSMPSMASRKTATPPQAAIPMEI